jgi:2'-5' RNA ligase
MGGVRPVARGEAAAPGREERLRLFVAVVLSATWHEALAAAQEELRQAGLRLRYVRPEGIHLTLKFLGETPATRLGDIATALGAAAERAGACTIELSGAGAFGPRRRPRVVWYGLAGALDELAALQRRVDEQLAAVGFAPEGRDFRPHLTLARVPEDLPPTEAERIVPAVERLHARRPQPFRVEAIALLQSRLGPGGARYTVRETWRLGETSAG